VELPDGLLDQLGAELTGQGAAAVVLVGSYARRDAHALSDLDLYAIGEGPDYWLERCRGVLVSVSWRTVERVRASWVELPDCIQAVPAWRAARVVRDTDSVGSDLVAAAKAWTWSQVGEDPDRWCAEHLYGYAEEVQKLRAALTRGDEVTAAVQRDVLALRMARVMAVRHRLLLTREEDPWPEVARVVGADWEKAQRRAFALDGASFAESCAAALDLFRMSAGAVEEWMDERQREVCRGV
jgi:hypothetical protein